ncbi:MerR family transcriptional regulator [Adhaeribacter pallidiroseus]|nr:MerR family transcriptional regulator [Adhaeribacter pallidiroseus]
MAALAGVSVRTLHLYDQMGLLKPAIRTEKNYRLYGKAEALRLQQILFYKELQVPLREIAEILDDPQFNPLSALELHKKELQQQKDRLETLLQTIDKTINHLKNKTMLSTEELYAGLPRETAEAWQQEAKEKWGFDFERSQNYLLNKSKPEFESLKEQAKANQIKLLSLMGEEPTSEQVQKVIAKHYLIIREFWGTAGSPDKQAEAYAGLADLYVTDERYTSQQGQPNPAFAQFLNKAMKHYAKKLK